MASSPDEGGSRHVGRIVDPLVREDGQPEPELELGSDPPSSPVAETALSDGEPAAAASEGSDPAASEPLADQPLVRGRALRDRLLERAESAKRRPDPLPGLEEVGREAPEIEPAVRPPSAPSRRRRAQLSPDMIAVFGTLLGLATVAALVALAIHLEPTPAPNQIATPEQPVESEEVAEPPPVPKRERKKLPGPWRIADAKNEAGVRVIQGTIKDAPFLRAVQDAGLPKKEAYRILTAFKGLRDFDKPNRSDEFVALLDRGSSRLKAFEYIVGKEEIYQAKEGADGLLDAKRLDLKVERSQVSGAFVVDGAVEAAAEKGGFESGFVSTLSKAVDGHLSLQELERGDVLRVVAQEVTVLGEFARYAGIEAIELRPAKGKPLRIYYFRGPSSRGYFDDRGRSPYEGGWRKPIPDAPVTSQFNMKRMHPVLKKVMPHTGTDFGAPSGTPVGSSSYGTVSFIGPAGPSGNLVKVEHPGDIETGYAHLSRFADGLKVGDRVKRLQIIGYVGSTGRSTGPHLHFTVKKKGEFIDPLSLNLDGMRVLPKEERDAFAQVKAKYDALLDAIALPAPLPALEPTPAPADTVSEPSEPEPDPSDDEPEKVEPAKAEAPPEKPSAPAPAKKASGNPVYLTDKELLEMQSGGDDGEVSE